MLSYFPPRYLFRRHAILRRIQRGERFLEIGAGSLLLSQELLSFFSGGDALEPAPEAVAIHANLPESLRLRLTLWPVDFASFNTPRSYDCLVACEVLEHVDHDQDFVHRMYSSLRPGGQVVVSVPARMKFWSIHDELVGHRRRYEKQELLSLFKQAGFEAIRVEGYGFPFVNLLRWPRMALAWRQRRLKQEWDSSKQTQESGINQVAGFHPLLGLAINPLTLAPFCWMASWFNRFYWSDGCIVVAKKGLKTKGP